MKTARACALAVGCSLAASGAGHADVPPAPALSMQAAHKVAEATLADVVQHLPEAERRRTTGAYVAFHADPRDPLALAACDDDGDYVVVMSDAFLVLADYVARAEATDVLARTHKLEAYAAHLAKEQRPGERLVAPPPGFFETAHATREIADRATQNFRALLTHVVAEEIAHVTAGDLVCAAPTPTHERGDDVWTPSEHAAALAAVANVNDARRVATADAVGTGYALEAGASEDAPAGLLYPFLTIVEDSSRAKASFGYLRWHPASAVRAQIVRTAASTWHKAHPRGNKEVGPVRSP